MTEKDEHRIVAKAVNEGTVRPLLDRGVTPDWFASSKHRDAIRFVLDHTAKYGSVPAAPVFHRHVGSAYSLDPVHDVWDSLLDTLANDCRYDHARSLLPQVEDALDAGDVDTAVRAIRDSLTSIESYDPRPSHLVDSMHADRIDERWALYEEREAGGGIIGYETGFPTIDACTMGLQPGQLITVLAQPKVGKSTVCLAIANHVYIEHEAPILFLSFEMSVLEMEKRQEALLAKVNFRNLQQGTLSPLEKKRYKDYLDFAKVEYDWPFHFVDASAGSTVSAVRSKIEQLEPALAIIDGIYMLTDEVSGEVNTATALTNITRSLKRTATQTGIPLLLNTQALNWKSKGQQITMDSAGYSSSFAQDSDVVLGLERIQVPKGEEEASYAYQRILKVLASRNTGLAQVELLFDWDEGTIEEVSL